VYLYATYTIFIVLNPFLEQELSILSFIEL